MYIRNRNKSTVPCSQTSIKFSPLVSMYASLVPYAVFLDNIPGRCLCCLIVNHLTQIVTTRNPDFCSVVSGSMVPILESHYSTVVLKARWRRGSSIKSSLGCWIHSVVGCFTLTATLAVYALLLTLPANRWVVSASLAAAGYTLLRLKRVTQRPHC